MKYLIYSLAIATMAASAFEVGGVTYEKSVTVNRVKLYYTGGGIMKYKVVFNGYALALYLPEETEGTAALNDVAKRLEFVYFWNIPSKKFGEAAETVLRRNMTTKQLRGVRDGVDKINSLYVDIKKGDRYSLTYIPGEGTELSHNGRPLGTIEGADFARAYFSIWLGKHPISKSLKSKLVKR